MSQYEVTIRADSLNPIEVEELLEEHIDGEVHAIQSRGEPIEPELSDELQELYRVASALLNRHADIRQESDTDFDTMEMQGELIRLAGYARDNAGGPRPSEIDPDEVFDN